ncbi:hypothetical protein KIH74_23275 [Kineosporia sp. J2-2]|uniref:Transmembrane protein n=1 Tax=Kineosporia corallincola TaxID=2835133 RepID=A0ABS5TPA7_9ACTN|nr:hypothetical protein [Kineosporia corallincola]MBT0771883.1 hypothetical protein [Kineosporia corallincola]
MAVRPGFGRQRNPLRRRSDRAQAMSALAAVLLLVAVVPVAVALSVGTWRHYSAVSENEQATRHLVSATVTTSDPETKLARSHLATLSWSYPDQVRHTGQIAVTQTTETGDLVPIWVTDSGQMVSAPMTTLNVWLDTLGLGLGLTFAAGLIGLVWYRLSRLWLDHRRTHALDTEWRRFNELRSEGFRDTRG